MEESPHTADHVIADRYSLYVPEMRQYDNGKYTCVGTNELGSVNHTTYVEANGG